MTATAVAAAGAHLDAVLAELGHPLADILAPGLDPDAVRSALEAAGLQPSEDAVALWAWHNGLRPGYYDPALPAGGEEFPMSGLFMRLSDAIEYRAVTMDSFRDTQDWSPQWFPVIRLAQLDTICLDCANPAAPDTAMFLHEGFGDNTPERLAARTIPTVAQGLRVWADLFAGRYWDYLPEMNRYYLVRDPRPNLPVAWTWPSQPPPGEPYVY